MMRFLSSLCSIAALLVFFTCSSLSHPTSYDTQASNITSEITERGIPAWQYYFGVDSATHQAKFNTLSTSGYRMISLSVYGTPPSVQYAAVWVQRTGPAYAAIHGASAANYQTWFDQWSAQGYVSTIVSVTGPSNSPIYAGVMEKITMSSWLQRCGMTAADFQTYGKQAYDNQLMMKSFREYGTAADRRYCALWHANPGFEKWTWWFTQSYSNYQTTFNAETQKRFWRPSYVTVSEDHMISSLFTDMSIGPWVARHGLTAAQLSSEISNWSNQGYYLIQLQGGGAGSNVQYAALFAKQDIPTPRQWAAIGTATGFKNNAVALSSVDNIMKSFMQANGVRQAQVSIGKAGKILFERGYTWAEPDRHQTQPTDVFLLASISKMFVEAAVQKLYDLGKLTPSTKVYGKLGYNSPKDSRASSITVQQLLDHQGGYDRAISGDPVFMFRTIAIARGGAAPASPKDVIEYVLNKNLDFTPGTQTQYSNYGYLLLSYLVQSVTGTPYYTYLQNNIFGGLNVQLYQTAGSAHINDPIVQESSWLGLSAADPTSNLLVPNVYGGDGLYKESCVGPSSLSTSSSSLVKFISKNGKSDPDLYHIVRREANSYASCLG
jgi:hypothetical protein